MSETESTTPEPRTRQCITSEIMITATHKTYWPDDFPGMTLAEAIAYRRQLVAENPFTVAASCTKVTTSVTSSVYDTLERIPVTP